jgi:chloramphenicol 3-O-phosphotransferase
MIILITGPTGAGKTDTSWALIERAAPMVFLDCDWFAARMPFSWQRPADVESVYQPASCNALAKTFAVLDASEVNEKDVAAQMWSIVQAATCENAALKPFLN